MSSIYVDDAKNEFRNMKMCHLFPIPTHSHQIMELHGMAAMLGLRIEDFQQHHYPHYDISQSLRKKAIELGAKSVTVKDGAKLRRNFKQGKEWWWTINGNN